MKIKLLTTVFCVLLSFTLVYAETPTEAKITKTTVKNLVNCLNSDNEGVKKSAIYFAGEYKIDQVLIPLMKILRSDCCEETKLLAAQSLFKLNNERAAYILKSVSTEDSSEKVRTLCSMLYHNYLTKQVNEDIEINLY